MITKINRIPFFIKFTIIFFLYSESAISEARNYALEIIVFSRSNLESRQESMPVNNLPEAPPTRGNLLKKSISNEDGIFLLPKSSFQLKNAASRIRTKLGGRILFHNRWIHPLKGSQTDNPWYKISGKSYDKASVDGYLRFSIERYIEISVDLRLIFPKTNNTETEALAFHLNEFRKFGSKDIQYFDHPALGMIIKAEKSDKHSIE